MKYHVFYLLCFLLVSLSSCKSLIDTSTSSCGQNKSYVLYRDPTEVLVDGKFNTYMALSGKVRVFQWGDLLDNVCTNDNIKVSFKAFFFDLKYLLDLSVRGRASWQFFFEKVFIAQTSSTSINAYEVAGEVEIKNEFPDSNGWVSPYLEIFFQTKGSYEDDLAFLKDRLKSIEIKADYKEYKQ